MNCRSCGAIKNTSILDLGEHPWCNDFLTQEQLGKEKKYPLHLVQCDKCELLQLTHTVSKEVMFKNHTYVSSTTKSLAEHFKLLALENKCELSLQKDDLILDIGGNDGTQLLQYKKAGLENVLNVESADNIAELSLKAGIPTINDFFNEELIAQHNLEGKVKLINASGVFFHLEQLHSVIRGIKKALRGDGVLVVQFMYAGTMVEKLNFDGIYHEHLCFYTLESLKNLLEPYGLNIFHAYHSDIHSGSIIAKISPSSKFEPTATYKFWTEKDKKYNREAFLEFAQKVKSKKNDLKNLLKRIKKDKPSSKIYAYGAPAKGNTLLNYFEIGNDLIDKCVEINELKVGLYLPKSHIPIVQESAEDLPDYYLLLAHNFAEEIIEKNQKLLDKGVKFIIPFPEIKIT
tara:strand:+ start:2230 stop:3435 length:1206 start_codon:yes stop_codon:yes gene_type:complete